MTRRRQLGLFQSVPAGSSPKAPREPRSELRALTLRPPWGQAIVFGDGPYPKRIENRGWNLLEPARRLIGKVIAIHSGLDFDRDGAAWIGLYGLWRIPAQFRAPPRGTRGPDPFRSEVIGVARVAAVVTESSDPWFRGPVGIVLDQVRALPLPVSVPGFLGFWRLSKSDAARVMEQLEGEQ